MNEESRMYSVEQIAERLGLHVRTVRAYVRIEPTFLKKKRRGF
jgi:hypothetical protein